MTPIAQYRSDVAGALKAYSKAVSKARSIHGRDCNYDPTEIDLAYHQATADARLRYEMAEDDAYKWGDRPPRELVPARTRSPAPWASAITLK